MKERNFDLIKSYVDNKKPYLNKVINFLKGLPGINDYINLEIDFYFNKDLLEEKINESFNFETLYEQAIGIWMKESNTFINKLWFNEKSGIDNIIFY